MTELADAIVIGAGILGASSAYHLKRAGCATVVLLERDQVASGGTGKSAAIIRQHYSSPVAARLTLASIQMLAAMRDTMGLDEGFIQSGWRMLLPPSLMEAAQINVAMQRELGIDTTLTPIGETEVPEWLNPDGIGGICHEPLGGYADPVRVTETFLAAFERIGGDYRSRTSVRSLLGDREGATGVVIDKGNIESPIVVNAAGPWSKPLAESIGLELPLRSVREQDTVWEARKGRPLPDTSISNAVDAIYLRPLGGRRFVLGRGFPKHYEDVDPYNYKTTPDEPFVADLIQRSEHRFPTLQGARRVDAYCALYDVTPDWMPFIGPRKDVSGYVDANGGSGHGFKIGPAIGRELATWLTEGKVAEDFSALSYDRLGAGNAFVGAYGGNRA